MSAIPTSFVPVEQPPVWQVCVDGIFIKQMSLTKAGHIVPQHVHKYDHHTMLAHGAVRVWTDKAYSVDYEAPAPILIRAGHAHVFMALADDTVLYCIHNVADRDGVELLSENTLEEV